MEPAWRQRTDSSDSWAWLVNRSSRLDLPGRLRQRRQPASARTRVADVGAVPSRSRFLSQLESRRDRQAFVEDEGGARGATNARTLRSRSERWTSVHQK